MKITIFGAGHVGLVQAAVLSDFGHDVLCVDIDLNKIQNLKQGIIPFYELQLDILIKRNYRLGRLNFTSDIIYAVNYGIIQCITVSTPLNSRGYIDLKNFFSVIKNIVNNMREYKLILNKSTVPVGTVDRINNIIYKILKRKNKHDQINYNIVSIPEFLREGTAVLDCMNPDRVVIGIDQYSERVMSLIKEYYRPFNIKNNRMVIMDSRSAELTKYSANCILATKISFINEIANLAELLDADIEKICSGLRLDPRIGNFFISPGCGYGGSCFPKDIRAMINIAKKKKFFPKILQAVMDVNTQQKKKLLQFIQQHFRGKLNNRVFALWGLSFKPDTDDVREALSLFLLESLWKFGVKIQAYDPQAMCKVYSIYGKRDDLLLMKTKEDVLNNADALIICTEWKNFYHPDFSKMKNLLKYPVIFDGRNLYDPKYLFNLGYIYYSIGRKIMHRGLLKNKR